MVRTVTLVFSLAVVLVGLTGGSGLPWLAEPTETIGSLPPLSEEELASLPRTLTGTCYMVIELQNKTRIVDGDVNTECGCLVLPGCFGLDDCHSCWWGNWGVITPWRLIPNDTDDFLGWKTDGNQQKWNSCTDDCTSSGCYNWNGKQRSTSTKEFSYFIADEEVEDELACTELDGIPYPVSGTYMRILELDATNHDFVNRLGYSTIRITLDCTEDECSGESNWYDPNSNQEDNCTAKVRAVVDESWYRQ